MSEEKIEIFINEDGSLDIKTDGIKGEVCISEVEGILNNLANIKDIAKTDEYYQKVSNNQKVNINKR